MNARWTCHAIKLPDEGLQKRCPLRKVSGVLAIGNMLYRIVQGSNVSSMKEQLIMKKRKQIYVRMNLKESDEW